MSLKKTIAMVWLAASLSGGVSCNDEQTDETPATTTVDSARRRRDSEIVAVAQALTDSFNKLPPIDTAQRFAPTDSIAAVVSSTPAPVAIQIPTPTPAPAQQKSVAAMPSQPEELYTINMDRVRKGPLGKMKIEHSLGILLGRRNVDNYMWKYNKEIAESLIAHNPRLKSGFGWLWYEKLPDLKVPMVNPELKGFFSPFLADFIADKEEIKKEVDTSQEVVIITRQPVITHKKTKKGVEKIDTVKKHVIWYYKNGKLVLAEYMSGGEGVDKIDWNYKKKAFKRVHAFTPEGVFKTNYKNEVGDRRDSAYKSKAFNAAMPYATPFENGTYLHTWFIDGNPRSHACARQTGRVAMTLYDLIGPREVKVVVSGVYNPWQAEAARKAPAKPYTGRKKKSHKKPAQQVKEAE